MDPITQAVEDLQTAARKFLAGDRRVLIVTAAGDDVATVAKVLRGEEWQPDNQRPFLVLPTAYREPETCFEQLRLLIEEHYTQLRNGLAKDNINIDPLPSVNGLEPYPGLVKTLIAFAEQLPGILKAPVFAWLPTETTAHWSSAVLALWQALAAQDWRFVVSAKDAKTLVDPLHHMDWQASVHHFDIDQNAVGDHMEKLMAAPAKGRAPGTMPGCAAPDVTPPPRPNATQVDAKTMAQAREAAELPASLTVEQGETLRRHVFLAARAAGKQDRDKTIQQQQAAVALCQQAQVGQEETLMTMVLANYHLQFSEEAEAETTYIQADALACREKAYPQLAQIRMALGYLQLRQKRALAAAETYEQAAWAGCLAESGMLTLESLRLAGLAYCQAKDRVAAAWCWQAGMDKALVMNPTERQLTQYRDLAARLIALYQQNGLHAKAEAVTRQLTAMEATTAAEADA